MPSQSVPVNFFCLHPFKGPVTRWRRGARLMVSKLLDILKLEHSDIHLALFVVFGLFLLGEHFGWIPPLAAYPWEPLALWCFVRPQGRERPARPASPQGVALWAVSLMARILGRQTPHGRRHYDRRQSRDVGAGAGEVKLLSEANPRRRTPPRWFRP